MQWIGEGVESGCKTGGWAVYQYTFRRGTRVYYLSVGPCLLGEYAVMRVHGRHGRWVRMLAPLVCVSEAEARRVLAKEIRRRRKRGYKWVREA